MHTFAHTFYRYTGPKPYEIGFQRVPVKWIKMKQYN